VRRTLILVVTLVWMTFQGHFAVRFFDFLVGRVFFDTEEVIVLGFIRALPFSPHSAHTGEPARESSKAMKHFVLTGF